MCGLSRSGKAIKSCREEKINPTQVLIAKIIHQIGANNYT